MKKSLKILLAVGLAACVAGCEKKDEFKPTESTIYVKSNGKVQTAVMDTFEESYYDLEELQEEVEYSIEEYCEIYGKDAVKLKSLKMKEEDVQLYMNYASVDDYQQYNDVLLFQGTLEEAERTGYLQEMTFTDTDGNEVKLPDDGDYLAVITEESLCIQTSGKIHYVSNNVSVQGKKKAKSYEASESHPACIIYK